MKIQYSALAALVLLLSSCSPVLDLKAKASGDRSGKATLTVSLGSKSRTVGPVADHYTLSFTPGTSDGRTAFSTSELGDASAPITIALGDWNLTVDSYDAAGNNLAEGTATFTAIAGSNSVSVTMASKLGQAGTGSMAVTYNWLGGAASSAAFSLKSYPAAGVEFVGQGAVATSINTALGFAEIKATSIPSGAYFLRLDLMNGGALQARISEVVQIYDGVLSAKTVKLSQSDMTLEATPGVVQNLRLDNTGGTWRLLWDPPISGSVISYSVGVNGLREVVPLAQGSSFILASGRPVDGTVFYVIASNRGGEYWSVPVYYYKVTGMSVTCPTLGAGQTFQLVPTLAPALALLAALTACTSSNPSVATVSPGGLVTAVAPGMTTISVSSADDPTISATVDLTVVQHFAKWANAAALYGGDITYAHGVAVDPNTGEVWRTGSHGSTASLAKFLPDGTLATVVSVNSGTSMGSWFNGIAVDSSSNVYFAGGGSGNGTVTVNGVSVSTLWVGGPNLVVGRLNSNGTVPWLVSLTAAPWGTEIGPLALDGIDGVYVGGSEAGPGYAATFNYGNGVTDVNPSLSTHNFLVVKYNSTSGLAQWARTPSTAPDTSYCLGLAAASTGVWAVGYITGTSPYLFHAAPVAVTGSSSGTNIAIAKFDLSGSAVWSKTTASGTGASQYNAVVVDAAGNSYAAGFASGSSTWDLGNSVSVTTPPMSTFNNLILVKYNSSGIPQWAKTVVSGSGASVINSIALEPGGKIFVGGSIAGTDIYDLGSGVTVQGSAPGNNLFVAEYDPSGNALWALSTTSGAVASQIRGVAVNQTGGQLYANGYMDSDGSLAVVGLTSITGASLGANAFTLNYQ